MFNVMTLLVFAFFPFSSDQHQQSKAAELKNWSCSEPEWIGTPAVENNIFTGNLKTDCTMETSEVLDYKNLLASTHDQIKKSKEVFAGPVSETFEGMDSSYYDATVEINESGLNWVRSDIHLATSSNFNQFLLLSQSKEINASGFAANLQKLNTRSDVTWVSSTSHRYVITSETAVKKPFGVLVGVFKNQAMKEMVSQMKANEETAIKTIVDGM